MKILVGVDGSPQSLAALDSFTKHLRWFRESAASSTKLWRCFGESAPFPLLSPPPPLPYQRAVSWAGHEAVHAYYDEESEEALTPARKLLTDLGIPFSVEKRVGDAAEEIVGCAAAGQFDLVVMGTHGRTSLANLVLGSVATKVLAS